jgi:hypothetical protein
MQKISNTMKPTRSSIIIMRIAYITLVSLVFKRFSIVYKALPSLDRVVSSTGMSVPPLDFFYGALPLNIFALVLKLDNPTTSRS